MKVNELLRRLALMPPDWVVVVPGTGMNEGVYVPVDDPGPLLMSQPPEKAYYTDSDIYPDSQHYVIVIEG